MKLSLPFSGEDVFISYSRSHIKEPDPGERYAKNLYRELKKKNFSTFTDHLEAEAGVITPEILHRKVKKSKMLVVVGSKRACKSTNIRDEIAAFLKTRRTPIVPIDFDGTVQNAVWHPLIEGIALQPESPEALESGTPSEDVISRIEEAFKYTKRNDQLRTATIGTLVILTLLVAASVVAGIVAKRQFDEASVQSTKAEQAANLANTKMEEANKAAIRANSESERAATETNRANTEANKANEQTRIAELKTAEADRATIRAVEQTRKADAATKEVARQTALVEQGKSTISQNYYNVAQGSSLIDPVRAIPWIQKAIETVPEGDPNLSIYKDWALGLTNNIPKLILRPEDGIEREPEYDVQGKKALVVSTSRKISLWDLKTGKEISNLLEKCNCEIFPLYPEDPESQSSGTRSSGNPIFSPDGKLIAALTKEVRGTSLRIWSAHDGAEILNKQDLLFDLGSRDFQNFRFTPDSQGIFLDINRKTSDVEIVVLDARTGDLKNKVASKFIPLALVNNTRPPGFGTARLPISRGPLRNLILTIEENPDVPEDCVDFPFGQIAVVKDLLTGKVEAKTPLSKNLEYIDFTGGGGRLVMINRDEAGKREIRAFDIESEMTTDPVRFATTIQQEFQIAGYTKDDNRLIVDCGNVGLHLWDLDQKGPVTYGENWNVGPRIIQKAFFSDDGSRIIYIFRDEPGENHSVLINDRATNQNLFFNGLKGDISVSSNGSLVMQNLDGAIWIKNARLKDNKVPTNKEALTNFQLESNECLVKAFRNPVEKTILTISINSCGYNSFDFSSPASLRLWDLRTGRAKWGKKVPLGTTISSRAQDYIVAFSPSGENFLVAFRGYDTSANSSTWDRNEHLKTLSLRSTRTGEPVSDFEPIVADIGAASFNSDGSQVITIESINESKWEIYYSALKTTGADRKEQFEQKNRDYLPRLAANGNYAILRRTAAEIVLKNLANNSMRILHFTNAGMAFLAAELLSDSHKININRSEIVAEYVNGLVVSISTSGDIELINKDKRKISLLSPFESNDISGRTDHYSSDLSVSADGKFILGFDGYRVNLNESQTRLSLLKNLTSPGFIYAEFLDTDEGILTIDDKGQVDTLKINYRKDKIPVWLADMGRALSGQQIKNNISAEPLLQESYLEIRNQYRERLVKAAKQKDTQAEFILNNWDP